MIAEHSAENIPPGYKQTEVGVIPENWEVKSIGDLVSISVGRDLKEENYSTYQDNIFKYPVFSNTVTNEGLYGFYNIPEYNGESLTIIGRGVGLGTAFARKGGFGAIGRLLVLFPVNNVNTNFLTEYINNKVNIFTESAGIPQLTGISIAKYRIPIPPTISEQESIAEALSDADAFIESLEQLISKKRQIKQGAMQELLTGKRRLPGFSGEWKVKLLDDLFDFSGGLSASRDQLSMEGYCYLHYGDIHTSKKNFIDVRSEQQDIPKLNISLKKVASPSLLNDGDVVFVDASEDDEGTSRHIVVFNKDKIPFISGLHTIVAKSKKNELDKQYLRYCFQTDDVKKQFYFFAVGTKVSGISKTNIVKITLPVPSLSEQAAIAAILSDMDSEITALEEKLAKARQIKQGMMQELLTGRIRLV